MKTINYQNNMKNFIFVFISLFLFSCSISKNNLEGKWTILHVSTNKIAQDSSGNEMAALLFLNYQLEGSSLHFDKNKAFFIADKDGKKLVEGMYELPQTNTVKLSSKGNHVVYNITQKNDNLLQLEDTAKMVIEIQRK